ncbi:MAG: enoyl-CoA hydratase/isomerase family protein [Anaerolineales bacterium]|jgi:enoyl-CoA hydratase
MFPKFETLIARENERLIRITLNRPGKLNAINLQMVQELHQLMAQLEQNHRDSVLVFCGAGEKAFAAGADVAELRERQAPEALQGINARLMDRIADFPFVTIAEIRGYCIGGGLELALACDMRFASDDAIFAQPEVSLNIIPAAGGTHRLPALVGRGRAREMIFSGLRIDAQRAHDIGLVNDVLPAEKLTDHTETVARRILKQGAEAIAIAKAVMTIEDRSPGFETANIAQAHLFETPEKMQRMKDFLDKK